MLWLKRVCLCFFTLHPLHSHDLLRGSYSCAVKWLICLEREYICCISANDRYYNLFHQILGEAFFQFTLELFKLFVWIFLGSFFHLPPTSLEILWNCTVYFVSYLACNKILVSRSWWNGSWNFEKLLHAKWSNFHNTQHNSPIFSVKSGEDEKMLRYKFCWKIKNSNRINWTKRLLPRSGKTIHIIIAFQINATLGHISHRCQTGPGKPVFLIKYCRSIERYVTSLLITDP